MKAVFTQRALNKDILSKADKNIKKCIEEIAKQIGPNNIKIKYTYKDKSIDEIKEEYTKKNSKIIKKYDKKHNK